MHTPRHWTGKRRPFAHAPERRPLPPVAGAVDARVLVATWTPLPLNATDVADQARTELGRIARAKDAWNGSRDTDRRA